MTAQNTAAECEWNQSDHPVQEDSEGHFKELFSFSFQGDTDFQQYMMTIITLTSDPNVRSNIG